MRAAILIACALAACGGNAGSDNSVACGPTSAPIFCSLDGNQCCTKLNMAPTDDTCQADSAGSCASGFVPETCDGPEDCATGQVCCVSQTAISCVATSSCAQNNVVCHDASDCAPGYSCCVDKPLGFQLGFCGLNCPG